MILFYVVGFFVTWTVLVLLSNKIITGKLLGMVHMGFTTPEQKALYLLVLQAIQNGYKVDRSRIGSGAVQIYFSRYLKLTFIWFDEHEISDKLMAWQKEDIYHKVVERWKKIGK